MKSMRFYLTLFVFTTASSCASSIENAIDSDGGGINASDASLDSGQTEAAARAVVVSPLASDWIGQCERFEQATDYTWDKGSEVAIVLRDNKIITTSDDVSIEGSQATITAAGNYRLSGSLIDGNVFVNAGDDDVVRLILDNAHLISSRDAPLYIANSKRTVIVLADASSNSIEDASNERDASQANAALYSRVDLAISGNGSLTVVGNYQDGITSKDGLIINGGTIVVNAVDDGIRGKDCLSVLAGNLSVESGGDGLKSDNESDSDLGYVSLKAGTFDVKANGDAITASTTVYVTQGSFDLTSGGGSEQVVADDASSKGIKGTAGLVIDEGDFVIDSADDALHTDGVAYLNGGFFEIASGDDGIHSDGSVEIAGPTINISKSYEGIEGVTITINDGDIHIASSDDGINASDGSGAQAAFAGPPGVGVSESEAVDGGFGFPTERAGDPTFAQSTEGGVMPPGPVEGGVIPVARSPMATQESTAGNNLLVTINGGSLVIDAYGDALDSNGSMKMTGGTVLASGPIENMNGAIDMGDCSSCGLDISGGFLVAAGSAGMAETPDAASSQNSVLVTIETAGGGGRINFAPGAVTGTIAAGTLVHIENAAGESLLTYAPAKQFASLVFSSSKLINGTYTVYTGGSCTGAVTDNLYQGGTYANGVQKATFTIDDESTLATALWTL